MYPMTFILIFTVSSVIASILTIAACMLFTQRRQRDALAKVYVE